MPNHTPHPSGLEKEGRKEATTLPILHPPRLGALTPRLNKPTNPRRTKAIEFWVQRGEE